MEERRTRCCPSATCAPSRRRWATWCAWPEPPATMLVKRARRAHVGAQALHRSLHARRRDGLLRRRRAGGHARRAAGLRPAHYAEAMAGKRWFGDAAGDIEAAAAANLGLLDSIAAERRRRPAPGGQPRGAGLEGMASSVPEYVARRRRRKGLRRHAELTDAQIALAARRRRAPHEGWPTSPAKTLADDWGFQPSVPARAGRAAGHARVHRPRRQRRARRQPGPARPTCR